MKTKNEKRFALAQFVSRDLPAGFMILMALCAMSLSLQAQENSADDAFDFINNLVLRIHDTDNYLTKTNVDADDRGEFELIRSYLYTNAITAIVLTHRGNEENNAEYLNRAAGIFRTFEAFQYTSKHPQVEGAIPNVIVSEDYHLNPGPTPTYCSEKPFQLVLNGNNAWYLMALGYYTLTTGDRQFVPHLERLADHLSSSNAQDQIPGSPTEGGIYFGWGSPYKPITYKRFFFSTEHQTESYSGLLYAAEVMKDEPTGAAKQKRYLESAYKILRFTKKKLYNPNNPGPGDDPTASFFHVGVTGGGAVNFGTTSLDAQTWTNLAFARVLQDIEDITGALDYAWDKMYGDTTLDLASIAPGTPSVKGIDQVLGTSETLKPMVGRGALWYEGDEGIWLSGSAQLAHAYDYAFKHLNDDATAQRRSQIIFDDMSAMEWPADEYTIQTAVNSRTYSWPKGGFACFSDDYNAITEPTAYCHGETYPHIEPATWRYFDIHDLNPYEISLTEQMLAPSNLTIAVRVNSVELTWDVNPLAVSYLVMRDGMPIAAISNLENTNATLSFEDSNALDTHVYTVVARDMSGNLGNVASVEINGKSGGGNG